MLTHTENFITIAEGEVAALVDESAMPEARAFTLLAARWLGYDLDDDHLTDGKADRGVDFWFGGDSGFE